jgi:CubicO group peptidase (beta-lactamase class C family)
MTRSVSDQEVQAGRVLDALGITAQQFLDFEHDIGREAVSTVDQIEPILVRPSRVRWPLTFLWRMNLDTFNQNLRTALDALGVGYCYMIKRKGRIVHIGSSGWAQLPDDPTDGDGQVAWGLHIPMNVASVSKFVTAIATVRLLRGAGIPLKTPVAGFLPQYWVQGGGIGAITFHDLLRHEAGLGGTISGTGTGNFAEARSEISKGSTGTGTYNYKNVNFATLRVLFATLTGALSPPSAVPSFLASLGISDDVFWDVVSASAYRNWVNDYVFAPASIAPRDFQAEENAAKAYATPPAAPGSRIEDGAGGSGPSGWHMGIGALVRLLDNFRTGAMMARWRAQRLLTNMYGLDQPLTTRAGQVYYKGGRKLNGAQGMDSAIYLMPGQVDFAVFVNSWDGTPAGHLGTIPSLIQNSIESVFSI